MFISLLWYCQYCYYGCLINGLNSTPQIQPGKSGILVKDSIIRLVIDVEKDMYGLLNARYLFK